ncbi:MAG: hypothetical protein ABS36_13480 [Acidobacteria bacterium SCN 69-37]|nr:MAG: hypothetical protein ABS36_13480 [Acidobacteria bacterium SCN 69-37]
MHVYMRTVAVAAVLAWLVLPAPIARAWGLDVHRRLTERALDGLPVEIRAFFNEQRAFMIERSVDPDLWRIADLRGRLGEEPPNHFLDIDDLGEPPPFTNVPREWDAFVARYGEKEANIAGRLPWRTEEIYDKLVVAVREAAEGRQYGASNARYLAALLAHYVEDGHVPFHAVRNYDGQLTGQRGLHARFETALILDHWGSFALRPVVISPIEDIRAFMFDVLVESARLTPAVLDADREAAGPDKVYGAAYSERFRAGAGAIAEQRVNDAIDAVASAITAAWREAGSPKLR